MRFGQMEVRTIASLILQRFTLGHHPGYELAVRLMPTLSPRDGLPMRVAAR
jgi:cytochrome P450